MTRSMERIKINNIDLDVFHLPVVPHNVDIDLLKDNLLLLDDEMIQELSNKLLLAYPGEDADAIHLSKKWIAETLHINTPYNIIRLNGKDLYAVFYGNKTKYKQEGDNAGLALGIGSVGKVKSVQKLNGDDAGTFCALKIISASEYEKCEKYGKKEFAHLKEQDYGIADWKRRAVREEKDTHQQIDTYTYQMLMKMAHGVNLQSFILADQALVPMVRMEVGIEILKVFDQLHKSGMLHMDIKLENIHYDRMTGKVTPVDFAFAEKMTDKKFTGVYCGTKPFFAPEIFAKKNEGICDYTTKSEVYSLGIVLGGWFGYNIKVIDAEAYRYGFVPINFANAADEFGELYVSHDYKDEKSPKGHEIDTVEFDSKQLHKAFLPDKEIREKVFDIINKMISRNPDDRPELAEVIDQLTALKDKSLGLSSRIMKTALFDVNEYDGSDNKFFETLKKFDQVCLVDTGKDKKGIKFYLQLKRILEQEGLSVCNSVFKNQNPKELIATVPAALEYYHSPFLDACFYVTRRKNLDVTHEKSCSFIVGLDDFDMKVTQQFERCHVLNRDFDKVIADLDGELTRMTKDYTEGVDRVADERIAAIKDAKEAWKNAMQSGELTYQTLLKRIDQLKESMKNAGRVPFVTRWFKTPTGKKNIGTIADNLKETLTLPRVR